MGLRKPRQKSKKKFADQWDYNIKISEVIQRTISNRTARDKQADASRNVETGIKLLGFKHG